MGKSKRLAAPREENFQTYEKDNNTNKKKMYLLKSIQNVNKTAAIFFLQLQSGIQLTEQQLSSYKLHQRQLKMKKIKPKNKTKRKKTQTTEPIYN